MKELNPYKDLIQRFLDDEISAQEAAVFKEKYANDEQFHREADKAIKTHLALITVSRMNNHAMAAGKIIIPELEHEKKAPVRPLFRKDLLIRVAAALMPLMVVSSVLFFFLRPGDSSIELYHEYFKERSFIYKNFEGETTLTGLSLKEILTLDAKTLGLDPVKLSSLLSMGITNMKEDNYGNAIKIFRLVAATKNIHYSQDAEWYLALCYIRLNEKREAVSLLDEIRRNPSHAYYSNALKLKKQLKRVR